MIVRVTVLTTVFALFALSFSALVQQTGRGAIAAGMATQSRPRA